MSATSVGQIGLDLVVNQKQFHNQMSGIQQLAKKTGKMLAFAFAVKKLIDFGKECLNLGSDLQEVQNVVDVTFPNMTAKVNDFAKSASASFGLSETMAKKFTGTYGAMAKAFGFTEKAAFEMGSTLTGLAGDVASFYNISQDEAYTKLKSVFSGETETLKDLGIVMTQTALDAYALANGYGKTTKSMSEAEKVALRYAFVQKQLTAAAGDFARTSDSWANQTRILKLQFDSLKASIGQGLINLFTPVIKVVNYLIGKLSVLATKFKSLTELLTGKKLSNNQINDAIVGADGLTESVSGIGDAAKKSVKEMKALAGFDELNDISSGSASSGSDSSGGVSGVNSTDGLIGLLNNEIKDNEQATNKFVERFKATIESLRDAFTPTTTAWKEALTQLKGVWNDAKPSFIQGAKDIKGSFLKVSNYLIKDFVPNIVNSFSKNIAPVFTDVLSISIDTAGKYFKTYGKIIKSCTDTVIIPALRLIEEVYTGICESIGNAWGEYGAPLMANLTTTFDKIQNILRKFYYNLVEPILSAVLDTLSQIWEETLKPLVEKAISSILEIANEISIFYNKVLLPVIDWLLDNLYPIIRKVVDAILETTKKAFSSIGKIIGSVIDFIKGTIKFIVGVFTGDWKKAWTGIKDIFSGIWDAIVGVVELAWISIQTPFKYAKSFFAEVWNKIKEVFSGVVDWFKSIFQTAWDGIKNAFSSVGTFFSGIWSTIKGKFSNVKNWFKGTFQDAWDAIKGVFSGVGSFFGGIWDKIKNKFTKLGTSIGNAISSSVKSGINGIIGSIEKVINKAIGMINGAIKIVNKMPGVKIGTIDKLTLPRLANGGFVKANSPQLAIIGDNRHHGEIVSPDDKLEQMALTAAKLASGGNQESNELLRQEISLLQRIIDLLIAILEKETGISAETIFDIVRKSADSYTKRTGKPAFPY